MRPRNKGVKKKSFLKVVESLNAKIEELKLEIEDLKSKDYTKEVNERIDRIKSDIKSKLSSLETSVNNNLSEFDKIIKSREANNAKKNTIGSTDSE